MRVNLIAIKRVKGVKDGYKFSAKRYIAKALVALGRARYADDEETPLTDIEIKPKASTPSPTSTPTSDPEPTGEAGQGEQGEQGDNSQEENDPPKTIEATQAAVDAAEEHNIDLSTVTGTGENGRITKQDVMALVDENSGT